jgi:hypothetical protein
METRLLTYAELADTLGITAASAKRLAIRRRWPKQPGNDGRSRVVVPVERLLVERKSAAGDNTGDSTGDDTAVVTKEATSDDTSDKLIVITALTRHIERLEQDLTALKAERDRSAALAVEAAVVPALRTTIDALKAALDSERGRVADLRIERDRLIEQMAKRTSRGWWPFRRRA